MGTYLIFEIVNGSKRLWTRTMLRKQAIKIVAELQTKNPEREYLIEEVK